MISLRGGGGGGGSLITSSSSKPPPLTSTPHFKLHLHHHKPRRGACKAELSQEAPIMAAIGACVLNSLVFPSIPENDDDDDDDEENVVLDSTDARHAVMGIISFIPYFNWLSWVFAWLDTGRQRYLVYSLVYLAPYLKTNLSVSPDDSWLPLASILICIFHLQLESSVRNGDFQEFQIFRGFYSVTGKEKNHSRGRNIFSGKKEKNLPSARDQSRDEIQGWEVPKKPASDPEQLNKDGDVESWK